MNGKNGLLKSLFRNEYNLRLLRKSGLTPEALKPFERLSEKKRAALAVMGVDEEEYREFARAYWFVHEAEKMESEFCNSCLTLMRHTQAYQKKHMGDIPDGECPHRSRNVACGPLCKDFVKATPEQEANFEHFCDIDTGEGFPVKELGEE